ncbi:MAG: ABC transporter substrate-binding protein [Bacteroidetes bacterium]|nr:ABC transporter substrate-binding protein [Bacteroidota bacterium]
MNINIKKKFIFIIFLVLFSSPSQFAQEHLRIVSCTPNWTNTVAVLGATDNLVGVTRYCIFPDSIPRLVENGKLEVIGGFVDINKSRIMELKPDLVLTSSGIQEKLRDYFIEHGIKVIHMNLNSLDEVYGDIIKLGEAINKKSNATELVANIKDELIQVESKYKDLPRVSVYYEINYFYKCVPGQDDFMTELIKIAGGDPIFSDRSGVAPSVTWEEVVKANPDVILLPLWANANGPYFEGKKAGYGTTTPNEVANRPGAKNIKAVINGKVRYIDSAKTKQAGPQISVAADLFGKAIHADGDFELLKLDKVPDNMETLLSFFVPFVNSMNICFLQQYEVVGN